MNPEASPVRELHMVVGLDGSLAAMRALDISARLLAVRPPGRITVVWVAHLTSTVESSADAVAIVESDFDQVAAELRAAARERLDGSGVNVIGPAAAPRGAGRLLPKLAAAGSGAVAAIGDAGRSERPRPHRTGRSALGVGAEAGRGDPQIFGANDRRPAWVAFTRVSGDSAP